MSDGDTVKCPTNDVGCDSDANFDESDGLLPSSQRSNNVNEGKLLKDWEGFMSLVKTNLGTGVLALPFAMKHAGLAIGPPLIIIMSFIVIHCMTILSSSSQIISKNVKLSSADYGKTAELSIIRIFPSKAHHFRRFVNCFLVIIQYGVCTVYVLFMAENLKQIIGHFDTKIWCLLLMPVLIIFCYIHSLDILSYTSLVGNACLMVALIIIYQKLFRGLQHLERLTLVGHSVPLAFGIIIFCFEGICVILPLENRMKKPENYGKVIWSSQLFIAFSYLLMAFGGYLHYGDDSLGSITLNLPNTRLYLAARGLCVINVFCSYLVQFYVPANILFKYLRNDVLADASEIKLVSLELAYRTVLVLLTGALAIAIPKLGLIISIFGATSGTIICLILPPLIELGTYYSYCSKVPKWLIIKDVIIIIIAIICCVIGAYTAIYRLVLAFNNHSVHHHSFNNMTQN